MNLTMGLFNRMVLQRNRKNRCDARFAGKCSGAGRIVARITRRGGVVKGFEHIQVGRAVRGAFRGRLRGLSAGGPYEIELQLKSGGGQVLDSTRIRNVLVGDVWILGGQSNMEGLGLLKDAAKPDSRLRAFYMDDRWDVARDPIHNLCDALDQVHIDFGGGVPIKRDPKVGTGPGVSFGQEMARRTGVPQGLIACAHGGTSMTQWAAARKNLGSRSLYGAMLRRFRKNGGCVSGVVWYQGCSETNPQDTPLYTGRMKALVRAMRRDFGAARLPFIAVQIAGVFGQGGDHVCWNSIQDQQRRLPDVIAHCAVVPAIDLEYDDAVHISGQSQHRLGRRLAQAMCALRGDRQAGRLPIAFRSMQCKGNQVIVAFDNVIGRLQAAGNPTGFTLAAMDSENLIFRTELLRNSVVLHTTLMPVAKPCLILSYGYGWTPYCNITDAADRSLPVMGPVSIGAPYIQSEFVRTWRISRALPSAGKLHQLAYPRNRNALGLRKREFPGWFADIHPDLLRCAPNNACVYFTARIECSKRMPAELCLGYDGPVKMWIDGSRRFHDARGINPACPDKAVVPLNLAPGRHEIMIALGSNNGLAYGVGVRLRRRIPTAIRTQPEQWQSLPLPRILT